MNYEELSEKHMYKDKLRISNDDEFGVLLATLYLEGYEDDEIGDYIEENVTFMYSGARI